MKIQGELQIDEERGVIYFTPTEGPKAGATLLRICRLPTPIAVTPEYEMLDITFGHGVSWAPKSAKCPRHPQGHTDLVNLPPVGRVVDPADERLDERYGDRAGRRR